ncbi:MAG: hypothetical protein ACHQ0J_00315 [Candidatus Dormibacterales bacterium]
MNRGQGNITVTTEVAFCTFCGRVRTLRREDRHVGDMVRTIVTCESCHRVLSSQIAVASAEPAAEPVPLDGEAAAVPAPAEQATPQPPESSTPTSAKAKSTPKQAPKKR